MARHSGYAQQVHGCAIRLLAQRIKLMALPQPAGFAVGGKHDGGGLRARVRVFVLLCCELRVFVLLCVACCVCLCSCVYVCVCVCVFVYVCSCVCLHA